MFGAGTGMTVARPDAEPMRRRSRRVLQVRAEVRDPLVVLWIDHASSVAA
jgi:hypothetical protein